MCGFLSRALGGRDRTTGCAVTRILPASRPEPLAYLPNRDPTSVVYVVPRQRVQPPPCRRRSHGKPTSIPSNHRTFTDDLHVKA